LLADATAPRISAGWIVAATRTIVQADKLRRLETWLINATTPAPAARIALLLDFVPVSTAATASAFIAGEMFSAELVFYPSATPLRAQLASRSASAPLAWPDLPDGLDAALGAYEAALAAQPWIDSWPLAARGLAVEQIEPGRLGLGDGSGLALPLDRQQTDRLLPMLGLAPISALCVWDGRVATLLAADTPVGAWYEDG
jgi:hypothetical protein